MIVRIKDITGAIYKFDDAIRVVENRSQIILGFKGRSEIIFTKKNIIYAHRENNEESEVNK